MWGSPNTCAVRTPFAVCSRRSGRAALPPIIQQKLTVQAITPKPALSNIGCWVPQRIPSAPTSLHKATKWLASATLHKPPVSPYAAANAAAGTQAGLKNGEKLQRVFKKWSRLATVTMHFSDISAKLAILADKYVLFLALRCYRNGRKVQIAFSSSIPGPLLFVKSKPVDQRSHQRAHVATNSGRIQCSAPSQEPMARVPTMSVAGSEVSTAAGTEYIQHPTTVKRPPPAIQTSHESRTRCAGDAAAEAKRMLAQLGTQAGPFSGPSAFAHRPTITTPQPSAPGFHFGSSALVPSTPTTPPPIFWSSRTDDGYSHLRGPLAPITDWFDGYSDWLFRRRGFYLAAVPFADSRAEWIDRCRRLDELMLRWETPSAYMLVQDEWGRFHAGRVDAARFVQTCLLYTSPSPRDLSTSRMPSSA